MIFKDELNEKGYVVIPDILSNNEIQTAKSMFYNWVSKLQNIHEIHKNINPHGIFKYHQAGHTEHAWYIRTLENVQTPFKQFYETDDLIVSFDSCCWINNTMSKKRDNCWTHTDQAPYLNNFECLQGFVSLTNNEKTSLVVYEGSHKLHKNYFDTRGINHKKNWNKIDEEYLKEIESTKKVLNVNAGSLVLWDSRTFHQNQYGNPNCEERIVQYVCYLPKTHKKNTLANKKKRRKYFEEMRTTSHWPAPLRVNGLQPQTYGDPKKLIDYTNLKRPNLSEYEEKIDRLI